MRYPGMTKTSASTMILMQFTKAWFFCLKARSVCRGWLRESEETSIEASVGLGCDGIFYCTKEKVLW